MESAAVGGSASWSMAALQAHGWCSPVGGGLTRAGLASDSAVVEVHSLSCTVLHCVSRLASSVDVAEVSGARCRCWLARVVGKVSGWSRLHTGGKTELTAQQLQRLQPSAGTGYKALAETLSCLLSGRSV